MTQALQIIASNKLFFYHLIQPGFDKWASLLVAKDGPSSSLACRHDLLRAYCQHTDDRFPNCLVKELYTRLEANQLTWSEFHNAIGRMLAIRVIDGDMSRQPRPKCQAELQAFLSLTKIDSLIESLQPEIEKVTASFVQFINSEDNLQRVRAAEISGALDRIKIAQRTFAKVMLQESQHSEQQAQRHTRRLAINSCLDKIKLDMNQIDIDVTNLGTRLLQVNAGLTVINGKAWSSKGREISTAIGACLSSETSGQKRLEQIESSSPSHSIQEATATCLLQLRHIAQGLTAFNKALIREDRMAASKRSRELSNQMFYAEQGVDHAEDARQELLTYPSRVEHHPVDGIKLHRPHICRA